MKFGSESVWTQELVTFFKQLQCYRINIFVVVTHLGHHSTFLPRSRTLMVVGSVF